MLAPLLLPALAAGQSTAQDVEFFEKQVRPILAAHCYSCHSTQAKPRFADLSLDTNAGARKVAVKIVPAIKGTLPMKMPPTGKLSEPQIAAIEKWVAMGLPWPEESPAAKPSSAFDLNTRRQSHWAWKPPRAAPVPAVRNQSWPAGDLDRFLLAAMESKGLSPAAQTAPDILLRRLTFDLTGLPPSPSELSAQEPYEKTVDLLLGSLAFGEHWARHWMDLVRYSESHGSEGDPDTPLAWRYRDYLIRAFNQDVPYDKLVREYIAGDQLPQPRLSHELRVNESLLGTANLRMVEHGFQPVDPWEDRVKWTDNQVDVLTKAFQGLTVSCARCHDHKFDAISQKDYYALYGTLAGARPTQAAIDLPEDLHRGAQEMAQLKTRLRSSFASEWLAQIGRWPETQPAVPELLGLGKLEEWNRRSAEVRTNQEQAQRFNAENFTRRWDLSSPAQYAQWKGHGSGKPEKPSPAGDFWITPKGDKPVGAIYPAGVYSHSLSTKQNAVITSPRFKIDTDSISVRMLGGNFSFAQLIIENYAVPRGGIYHIRLSPKKDQMGWTRWDTTFWKAFTGYIEFATKDDVTHFMLDEEDGKKKPRPEPVQDGRSWFGVQAVWFHNNAHTPKEETIGAASVLQGDAPASRRDMFERWSALARLAVENWRDGRITNEQAVLLDALLQAGILRQDAAVDLVAAYRRLENAIPVARRAPSVIEECAAPQPLLVRGNHKNPGDPVPQRYLTALGGPAFADVCTTRLALAEQVASEKNPLTARVFVNRVWQKLFGRGLVASMDNFGKLGDAPSHPELLDWLGVRFVEDGWSVKRLIRTMVTSRAYRMSSHVSPDAANLDPSNIWLSHMPVRRLEAEAIRDSILSISGHLDRTMYGASVPVYYAHDTGKTKGDNPKGPMDGDGRRSVYLEIRRNATNPFLEVFDFPIPSTTRGQRDLTNVPAQSLALMNSPFVRDEAMRFAELALQGNAEDPKRRVEIMFLRALARSPDAAEIDRSLSYLAAVASEYNLAGEAWKLDPRPWRDLAVALFNLKEFLYIL